MGYFGNSPEAIELRRLANAIENAAKDSADSVRLARDSSVASRKAAFWTMIAGIAAALGLFLNVAITLGWMNWAKFVTQ